MKDRTQHTETYKSVTTEGKPSGTKATRMETAKVTVCSPLPLYAVVIPTTKNTTAKTIAIADTIMTNRPLCLPVSDVSIERRARAIHFDCQRTLLPSLISG